MADTANVTAASLVAEVSSNVAGLSAVALVAEVASGNVGLAALALVVEITAAEAPADDTPGINGFAGVTPIVRYFPRSNNVPGYTLAGRR
tara:strand:- start:399 stop:668 length:270 start_codon:yes stop_codon:yes gene_type:complete